MSKTRGQAPGIGKGKGLIRSLNRRGSRSRKMQPVEAATGRLSEPSACERCGAIFARRRWRREPRATHTLLARVSWTVCPACEQVRKQEYFGRVLIRGTPPEGEIALRRRIRNIVRYAQFTQPARRIVSIEREGDVLEVLTTSQKLAHRIVHELKKVFRGRASYRWADDRSLIATWQPGTPG